MVKKFTVTVKNKPTMFKLAKKKVSLRVGQVVTLKYSFNKNAYSLPSDVFGNWENIVDYSLNSSSIRLYGRKEGKDTVSIRTQSGLEQTFELEVLPAKKKR